MTTLNPASLKGWNRDLIVANDENPPRALIAGTGLDVYEIFSAFRCVNEDWEDLREWFSWLRDDQLRAVLGYCYEHLPDLEERWRDEDTIEAQIAAFWQRYPDARLPHR